ncbi:MAG TPA: uroporphyrinogen-III C-methyltransferase [Lachnospiraceae bacterium]|nr:uroporphyrinogen-III C-methyltransferase [Lachnospiraceae bacterium]
MLEKGKVWLVGAGPGDLGLLTIKGKQVLEMAEVVVYDALVSMEIAALIPDEAKKINVGKRSSKHLASQEEINQILVEEAMQGKRVVRLKGGDPFVFGRGGEELELLIQSKIPYEVVPGITSAVSVPAYAGIPVTHRDYTSSFHIITGHARKNGVSRVNYDALVRLDATLIFLMGISALEEICHSLIQAGLDKDTPAAVLENGTTAKQRRIISTVHNLKQESDRANIQTPAIIIVGKVCALAEDFAWVEKQLLAGKQVLITRPKDLSSTLARKLRDLGAHVIELPSIQTEAIVNNAKLKEAIHRIIEEGMEKMPVVGPMLEKNDELVRGDDRIQLLSDNKGRSSSIRQQWLIFTSPTGVRIFFEQLMELEIDIRRILQYPQIRFAVVGNATKKELLQHGILADYMPSEYSGEELAKGLLERTGGDFYATILRAAEGTKEMLELFKEQGISYIDVPLYDTLYNEEQEFSARLAEMIDSQEIDYVTFTSASTVKGFVNTIRNADYSKVNAICIGAQTGKEARRYGMNVMVAKEASIDSMIELMMEN